MITIAQWDTDNLGLKIGNLTFETEISAQSISEARLEAKAEGYDLLYIKGVHIPTEFLCDNLALIDEKTIYIQQKKESFKYNSCTVSALNTNLSEDLLQLAYESGKYSRYNLDKNFPPSTFPTLYKQWIVNSLKGEIADDVLVVQKDGKSIGLLTYQVVKNVYVIGLVAISPQYAGKGIGTCLMQSFLSNVKTGSEIEVATQRQNSIACHFYEKNGFNVKSTTNIYHFWIK